MAKPITINIKQLTRRFRAASSVFRHGYPRQMLPTKASPLIWPDFRNEQPQWQTVDIQGYIEEGFNLNSLIYSAIMYKARASIIAPLRAYLGDPQKPELAPVDHELSKLIARPNPHQSWSEFQGLNTVYENIAGNCYIFMDRDREDNVVAMWSLRPDRVFIIPGKQKVDGQWQSTVLGFLYVPEGRSKWLEWDKADQRRALKEGLAFPILAQDMMHVKLPNPGDPLEGMGYGLSPISPGAQSADIDNSVTKFLKIFFDRGVMLTGYLKFKYKIDEPTMARARARWREIYGGYEQWDIGVMDEDAEYQRLGLTFDEMGFSDIDARNESRVVSPFGVPLTLIESRPQIVQSTYSNKATDRQMFWEDTMVPESRLFETEYQYYLQTADGGFVAFDYSKVPALAPSRNERIERIEKGFEYGAVLKSEYREALSLPYLDGSEVFSIPSNRLEFPVGQSQLELSQPAQEETPQLSDSADTTPQDDNEGAAESTTDDRIDQTDEKSIKAFTPDEKKRLAKQIDTLAESFEDDYRPVVNDLFEQDRREVLAIVNSVKKKHLNGNKH